jgi:putative ABC transport system substrate-binding protein
MIQSGWASSQVSTGREGGNITGVTILSGELAAKRLELLRQLVPRARDIAVLIEPAWPTSARFKADVEAAAPIIGLPIRFLRANNEREIVNAFEDLSRARADALLVGPGAFLDSHRDLLVARTAKMAFPQHMKPVQPRSQEVSSAMERVSGMGIVKPASTSAAF